jgi:hypothetical protein
VDPLLRTRLLEQMKDEFAQSSCSPAVPVPLVLKTLIDLVTEAKFFNAVPPGVGVPSGAWPEGLEWMSFLTSLSRPPASQPTSPSPPPELSPLGDPFPTGQLRRLFCPRMPPDYFRIPRVSRSRFFPSAGSGALTTSIGHVDS